MFTQTRFRNLGRTAWNVLRAAVLASALSLLSSNPAWATDYTWAHSDARGYWSDPSNWRPYTGSYPNGASDTARFNLRVGLWRWIFLTQEVTINQFFFTNLTRNSLDFTDSNFGSNYKVLFRGTNPTIDVQHSADYPGVRFFGPVDVGDVGVRIISNGNDHSVSFAGGVIGEGNIIVGDGNYASGVELSRDGSPGYSGNFIVEKYGLLEVRYNGPVDALGNTNGNTIIKQGGRFWFRDLSNPTIPEPFVIEGVHPYGSIRAFDADVTMTGPVTLQANGSFSVADWASEEPGKTRTFTINSLIDDGAETHSVFFLGDYSDAYYRRQNARNNVIVLGNQNTYGGNTYITSNYYNENEDPWVGNVKLAVDNALPTGTKLILGGRHDAGEGTYIGIDQGNGKLILNGHSQELAGLETAGTGTANRVVGGSSTLSTLILNIPANTTNTYTGVLGGPGTNENNLALHKTGPGTLILSGQNTYTGITFFEEGKLSWVSTTTNNHMPNSSVLQVGSGAILDVTGLDGPGGTDTLILASGQTLQGNGTVQGNVQTPAGAFLGAGMSPGHLTINGDYSQAGTLLVEIAGYRQGGTGEVPGQWATNGYDWVSVTGSAVLGGTLQIDLLAGFQPDLGDTFDVLTADGGITDQGLSLQYSGLLPGQEWTYRILFSSGTEQILQLQVNNVVPEPSTLALLGMVAIGFSFAARRRISLAALSKLPAKSSG